MKICASKLLCLFALVLLILFSPSLAAGITVSVPDTDIVGELGVEYYGTYIEDYFWRGCIIKLTFARTTGSGSIEDANLRWLQLVSTNTPFFTDDQTQYVQFIDSFYDPTYRGPADEPFYWSRGRLAHYRSDSELFFGDMPNTAEWYYGWELEWYDGWDIDNRFELYLVRHLAGKTIQPLARIKWGYYVDTSGEVRIYTARLQKLSTPSKAIEQALAEDFPDWSFVGASGGNGVQEPSSDGGGVGGGGGGGG